MLAVNPTVDPALARSILAFLGGLQPEPHDLPDCTDGCAALAAWLVERELGPLAYACFRDSVPELAVRLQGERFSTLAQNTLHWRNLQAIDAEFAVHNLTAVLLKGGALAGTVYEQPDHRPMGDVDLWLRETEMSTAITAMAELGFDAAENSERPLALQALADGEIQFYNHERQPTLVELHLSPFAGWWLRRTAVIDTEAVWARRQPLPGWKSFDQLAPEDTVLHLAIHTAVNHQFGMAALRSLIDIALTTQVRGVDWQVVASRARQWQIATAVWLVLSLLQDLLGMPGLDDVLWQLQPSAWRRRQLKKMVSPASILAGNDMRQDRSRFLLLLLLVDRPSDALRLIYRTLWPEQAWLAARYGGEAGSWQHLKHVLLHGDV